MAYSIRRRNFTLAGVDLGNETIDSAGNDVIVSENGNVTGEVLPPASGGFGGSVDVFGISVPLLNLGLGAIAGYFMGSKGDGLRNAALGAAAGVGVSYFMNR